jgi:Nucleoside-diphosphate-sugar pyrophosphorylase involved in lipopolysaccharide biosynthesis/translation initiation factor 2B, gamma/epsilon subunits (eIF-2Bgamma/eIF-2Bepsilon)
MEGVVLAAGLGKRMRPLSYIMPKPLFILGDKTAIEHIVDWLYSNGIYRIHVVLSYSGRIVENVLKGKKKWISISFIRNQKELLVNCQILKIL